MDDLRSFLHSHGFDDIDPILDEKFHEFRENGHKVWFIGSEMTKESGEPMVTFTISDWRHGEKLHYRSNGAMSKRDEKTFKKKVQELAQKANKEKEIRAEQAKIIAQKEWPTFPQTGQSAYLLHKRIDQLYGARLNPKSAGCIPCRDSEGVLWGYQTIYQDGSKYFISGQKVQGTFHIIGEITSGICYICEGFATGASIHMATGAPVVVAFYANNLEETGAALRTRYPDTQFIFAGDDDRFSTSGNAGRTKATSAAQKISAKVVFPKFKDDSTKSTDFNDLHCLEGLDAVRLQLISEIKAVPIATERTGFHSQQMMGKRVVYVPEYEDLRQFFERKHAYKNLGASELCYIWTGTHYKEASDASLSAFAQKYFDPTCTNTKAKEFIGIVHRTNMVDADWFSKTSERKINFKNGVLDLETRAFMPHSPDVGFRYVLGYDYQPTADAPVFKEMIDNVCVGDPTLQQVLLEYMAYAISGDRCWIHKALILEGSGRNGKSTLMKVIRNLVGSENCTSITLSDLQSEYSRQRLDGKLLNMATETPSKSLMDSSVFKSLVAGDEISVRAIYKMPYDMRNRAKMVFACNELPQSLDTTHAFFARFLLVPFRAVFDQKHPGFDPEIDEKLEKELPGIFNIVLKAYGWLHEKKGFLESKTSDSALEDYKKDLNPLIEWISERVEWLDLEGSNMAVTSSVAEIYKAYAEDMRATGHYVLSSTAFGKKMREIQPDYLKRKGSKKIENSAQKVLLATRFFRNPSIFKADESTTTTH